MVKTYHLNYISNYFFLISIDKAVCFLYDLGQSVLISGVRFVAVSNIHGE